jgi:hypothetical protein
MDCDKIKERNENALLDLIGKYNIKLSLDELLDFYTSVYIHKDFKQKRIRLLGIKEEYVVDNEGRKHKTGKKKTVQLYVLSKRMIQTLPQDSVFEISRDLSLFSFYFEQLKLIRKLEFTENAFETFVNINSINSEEYHKMQE